MALLVKLIGGGLGLASEAIHDYRARSRSQTRPEPPSPNPPAAIATPSSSRTHDPAPDYTDAPPAYVEVADEATAEALVRAGKAEYVPVGPAAAAAAYDGKQRSKASEGAGYDVEEEDGSSSSSSDDDDDDDSQDGVELDDEAWELDEMARRVAPPPPTYADHEQQAAPEEDESEEATARKEEQMMRDLVRLAGPPPRPARRIPCPVIIPQRRPRNKDRGFVRAYAPVLADCGVSQDAFLKFQEDWLVASKADPWIDIVFVAAGIVGFVPEVAAQIVGTVVQVVAGTARELQSRHRRNTFLDRANRDLFMPRGLYAMVMAFKDQVPGQQPRGPLSRLAGAVGKSLFSSQRLDINQTAAKYSSSPDAEMSGLRRGLKNIRLVSGKTYTEVELPEAAALVYPDLDRAVEDGLQQGLSGGGGKGKGKGKGPEKETVKDKFKGAGEWVQDYMDRKAQAAYERDHRGSSLAVPADARRGFSSRFSDPSHPANSGSLLSLVTGGAVDTAPRRRARRAAKQERRSWKRERKDERRASRGKAPRGPSRRSSRRVVGPDGQRRKRKGGVIKKLVTQDVLYLLVVNLPTEEEVQRSVAELERMMGPDVARA